MRFEVSRPYGSLLVVPLDKQRSGLHGDGNSGIIIQQNKRAQRNWTLRRHVTIELRVKLELGTFI